MRRKEVKGYKGNKRRLTLKNKCLAGSYIYVTEHAIKRYQERFKKVNQYNAQRAIVEGVKRRRLIALTKFGGREIRENIGVLYVCELNDNCLCVITVLISQVDLRFVS